MLAEHERAVRASLARWDDDAGDEGPLTLEGCVCGECFHCPDGWHWGDDLPCSCTPDCALGVEPDLFDSDDLGDYQATDFGDEGQP